MTTVALGIGPLALLGVILVIGLIVALFSSRSWLGALFALGGLFLCGMLGVAFLLFFRLANSRMSMDQVAVQSAPTIQHMEAGLPPLPPMPPLPQQEGLPDGASQPLRVEAEGPSEGATTTPPQSAAPQSATTPSAAGTASATLPAEAPLVSNEGARVPNGLPEWVTGGERRVDGVYRMPVTIGPFPFREDCNGEKPKVFAEAVKRYANEYLSEGADRYVALPMSYINQHIYRSEAEEYRDTSFGRMVLMHYLLEFDDSVRQHIDQVYHQALIAERLKYSGMAAAGVLGLLVTVFGYLKLDTLSRGYYTGRLRAAAAVAILGLVAMLVLAAGLLVVA